MLEYHAAYYKIEDGWYMARVLDFPGTISQGKTLKSARIMIRDALKLMAECNLELGKPLPPPNPRARDRKADYAEKIPLKITARLERLLETPEAASPFRRPYIRRRSKRRTGLQLDSSIKFLLRRSHAR